jgi:hypothetical protein
MRIPREGEFAPGSSEGPPPCCSPAMPSSHLPATRAGACVSSSTRLGPERARSEGPPETRPPRRLRPWPRACRPHRQSSEPPRRLPSKRFCLHAARSPPRRPHPWRRVPRLRRANRLPRCRRRQRAARRLRGSISPRHLRARRRADRPHRERSGEPALDDPPLPRRGSARRNEVRYGRSSIRPGRRWQGGIVPSQPAGRMGP